MFSSLGLPEIAVLMVLALFLFGPERLPGMAEEAGKALRRLRRQLRGLTDDLKAELGPEVGNLDLASLHPKAFVRKHLFEDDEDDLPMPVGPRYRPLPPSEPAPFDPDAT